MDWVTGVTARVAPTSALELGPLQVVVALVVAATAVVVPPLWRTLRVGVTLAHELGHAFVGVLCGRRFLGFVVRGDMSGEAITSGKPTGPGRILTTWAGYPAPALLGVTLVAAGVHGWASVVLTAVLVALVLSVIRIRSFLTAVVLLAALAAGAALWWWRDDTLQASALLGVGAFLIIGAWHQWAAVARSQASTSDPGQLASLTRVPRLLWTWSFALVIAAASAGGLWFLADVTGVLARVGPG